MADKKPTEKELRNRAVKQLYLQNNGMSNPVNSGLSQSDISDFISGKNYNSGRVSNDPTPDYMKGVSPDFSFTSYEPTRYDDSVRMETLETPGALENMRAENQGVLSSLANSTANFTGKTAINVAGGLVGAIWGGIDAIASKDFSKLYDNDLTTALDQASDSIGEIFKVYKSSGYEDKFILNKMVSNPLMFTDEFMDTLSFTAGAIVTELISGGLASSSILPKATNYLNKLTAAKYYDKALDITKLANSIERTANINSAVKGLERAGKLTRQLATGAFWEGSVEARQLSKEMSNRMTQDYIKDMQNKGYDITEDDIPSDVKEDIENRVKNASGAALALNIGLVGFSNLSQFPTIFKSMGSAKKAAAKELATEVVDGAVKYTTKKAINTGFENGLRKTWSAIKNPFMEGFVEEGGQGLISKTLGSFYDRKNDIEGIGETSRFLDSFGKAFSDTYLTKEGINEVLMGALVGGVGSPGAGMLSVLGKDNSVGRHGYEEVTDADGKKSFVRKALWDGGVVGGIREDNELTKEAQVLANTLNSNPDIMTALKHNYDMHVRSYGLNKDMDEAVKNNDQFAYENVKDDIMFNYINNRLELGLIDDLMNKKTTLEEMSPEDFYTTFKGQKATDEALPEEMEFFQKETIKRFDQTVKSIKRAKETSNSFLIDGEQNELAEAMALESTYFLSKASMMKERENDIYNKLSFISNKLIKKPRLRGITLRDMLINLKDSLKTNPDNSENKKRFGDLTKILNKFKDNLPADLATDLMNFMENDPSGYKAVEDDMENMINDLQKVNDYKNQLISKFELLQTSQGAEQFKKLLKDIEKRRETIAEQNKELIALHESLQAENQRKEKETSSSKENTSAPISTFNIVASDNEEVVENTVEESVEEDNNVEEELVEEGASTEEDIEDDTTEEIVNEEVDYAGEFDRYLGISNNLLELLIPLEFLRNNPKHVDYVKSNYVKYRNSKSLLADVGTPKDIEDYRFYVHNVIYKSNTQANLNEEVEPSPNIESNTVEENFVDDNLISIEDAILEIEENRKDDIRYWNVDNRQNNIIEGRKITKEVVKKIKDKYDSSTIIGVAIRILEKVIDFNQFSIEDMANMKFPGNPDLTWVKGTSTETGMALPLDNIKKLQNLDEDIIRVFIHELVHTFTKKKLGDYNLEKRQTIKGFKANLTKKEREAIENLERIYNKVKKLQSERNTYGLKNLDEFLAEAFSSKLFQADLAEIESEGKKSNLFKDWFNAIRDLLFENLLKWSIKFNKSKPNKDNITGILEDVMAWTEDLIDNKPITHDVLTSEINKKYDNEINSILNTEEIYNTSLKESEPIEEDLNTNAVEDSNTEEIITEESLIEKQVSKETKPEIPEDTSNVTPVQEATEEFLDEYRGTSLTNIHAVKTTVNGKFSYVRNDDGKYKILDTYPRKALSPEVALPGSEITVRVATREEYAKYANNHNVETAYDNSETLPLAAFQNGNFIGFMLTPKGAVSSSKNKVSNEDLIKLRNFRIEVFNNQNTEYKLTVQDKTMGVITYRKDNDGKSIYRPIKEHLSIDGKILSSGVSIAVDVNGVMHTHTGADFEGNLINPSYGNGYVYALIPTANDKHVKVPLRLSSINDNDYNTVYSIIKYFMAHTNNQNDTGIISERNELRSNTGIDLSNINDFYNSIANILYIDKKGVNQFFNRVKEDDNSYSIIIKSPSGANVKFGQREINDPKFQEFFKDFIKNNFYRAINVQMMNQGQYSHLNADVSGKLTTKDYNNYINYIVENDLLLSDVYGERVDNYSNEMSYVLAPFIKINYPSVGNYSTTTNNEVQSSNNNTDLNTTSVSNSFLDSLDADEYDINFSMLDLKNNVDNIISPDIENEIDNFIKFCK